MSSLVLTSSLVKLLRTFLVTLATASLTAGCAHQAGLAREPSNAEVESAPSGQLVQIFQNVAATQAFLITEANGVRRAVCRVNVAHRSQLVPSFIPIDPRGGEETYGLPECRGEQLGQIADVAMKSNRPLYAGLPVVLGVVCAVDFGLSLAATVVTNKVANRLAERKSGRVRGVFIGAQTAGGLVVGGASVIASKIVSPASSILGLGVLGAVCTGAGVAVGYLLVPPQ